VPGVEEMVRQLRPLEAEVAAPFTVQMHGDFNLDNIIHNRDTGQLHYVDVHRSGPGDYAQDISVFLVSNYRLQIFDAQVRRRLAHVMETVHHFAVDFARRHGDAAFTARLSLGLARSFITSCRFVLDQDHAKSMFLRARYLMQRLLAGRPENDSLPREILVA
jgi:aminoglycoside phosphotransferase (APT) family kinase protein